MKVSLKSTTELADAAGSRLFLANQRANVLRFHSGSDRLRSTSRKPFVHPADWPARGNQVGNGAKRLPQRSQFIHVGKRARPQRRSVFAPILAQETRF